MDSTDLISFDHAPDSPPPTISSSGAELVESTKSDPQILKTPEDLVRSTAVTMDSTDLISFDDAPDHPPPTTLPSGAAVESSMEPKPPSPTVGLTIFCLHYLGCNVDSIFRVLESYRLDATHIGIAHYIKNQGLMDHHQTMNVNPNGREVLTRSNGSTLTIDFVEGKPVELVISCVSVSALSPYKSVTIITEDGKQISTEVTDGKIRFLADGTKWTAVRSKTACASQLHSTR